MDSASWVPSPLRAFDRTYKGLKLGATPLDLSSPQAPFDRTYKGLKLDAQQGGLPKVLLLTVPIRV